MRLSHSGAANERAKQIRGRMRGLPVQSVSVILCAVGCRISCESIHSRALPQLLSYRLTGKSRTKTATGVYRENGKILCDCHKIETAVSDFAFDCAQNKAKRPVYYSWPSLTCLVRGVMASMNALRWRRIRVCSVCTSCVTWLLGTQRLV